MDTFWSIINARSLSLASMKSQAPSLLHPCTDFLPREARFFAQVAPHVTVLIVTLSCPSRISRYPSTIWKLPPPPHPPDRLWCASLTHAIPHHLWTRRLCASVFLVPQLLFLLVHLDTPPPSPPTPHPPLPLSFLIFPSNPTPSSSTHLCLCYKPECGHQLRRPWQRWPGLQTDIYLYTTRAAL